MSQVLRLTERNFDQKVHQCQTPVLVEFSASWCVPSQQQKPLLRELAKEYNGKLSIGELNVDQNPRVAAEYRIMGCQPSSLFIQPRQSSAEWAHSQRNSLSN